MKLAGEVRSVNHTEIRLKEAEKLGFKSAFLALSRPSQKVKQIVSNETSTIQLMPIKYALEIV